MAEFAVLIFFEVRGLNESDNHNVIIENLLNNPSHSQVNAVLQ